MQVRIAIIALLVLVLGFSAFISLYTSHSTNQPSLHELLNIIQLQNHTIAMLHSRVSSNQVDVDYPPQSTHLTSCAQSTGKMSIAALEDSMPSTVSQHHVSFSSFEDECEERYGFRLADNWRQHRQIWCSSQDYSSQLLCYPYRQKHKDSEDMFCVAENFVIDFSKVHGEHAKGHKPPLGSQYLDYMDGSLSASCSKTSQYRAGHFMPHQSLQFRTFRDNTNTAANVVTDEVSTYLLARDEDCENSFHSTADFMNMFLVQHILGLSSAEQRVVLFDKHPDGPYTELINKAFAPVHGVHRKEFFSGKKIKFKRLLFHLESPAGLIFPKVSRPDPMRCIRTSLFDGYRRFILNAFNLLNVPPPPIPAVTLILRHRTDHKNVGRIMANENEIVNVLKSGNMMTLLVTDLAKLSFGEQLKIVRNTNVMVGVHGAGLMFIMFAADEAVLVEIHPSYRQDRHFRHASRLSGKIYMPLRSLQRESCVGSSDNVVVPVDEFAKAIDGALRLARSFDDGLSECGLICPPSILALDGRLDGHYTGGQRKGRPLDTHFPCG